MTKQSKVVHSIKEATELFGEDFDACYNPVTEQWDYAATTHIAVRD